MAKDARHAQVNSHGASEKDPGPRDAREARKQRKERDTPQARGFISIDDVKAKRAHMAVLDAEPTSEELALESERMAQPARAKSKKRSAKGEVSEDLLGAYMAKLGSLPLYTPEEELAQARALEEVELGLYRQVLAQPRACELLRDVLVAREETAQTLLEPLDELIASYRRAALRAHKKHLADSPARIEAIDALSRQLRSLDFDKDLLEALMARLRPEVWSRRVLGGSVAFRLTHRDLNELERSRGTALRLRNGFARANLRLVISVARHFHHYRLPFIDLIQEGNVGLLKAVHRFDHNRGFRFSTYAHWWIRQCIERALVNKGSQVRLPVHVMDARRQIGKATQKLTHVLGRAPTQEEVAKHIDMPLDKVEQTLAGVQQDPLSLDESVGGDEQRKFLDLMHDKSSPAVDESLIRENSHARVRELLHLLNPIERDIIRRRFGLGSDSDQTLDDIGRLYNLSRERVRQIQAQGLNKMRRMCERRRIE